MRLSDLLSSLKEEMTVGDKSVEISGIAYDSRKVKPGDAFVAIRGFSKDGTGFVGEAVKNGARAVVVEGDADVPSNVPKVVVPNARIALAELSAAFNGHPSRKLKMIGITGTNGKTTISYLIEAILRKKGHKVGVIGTVDARINGRSFPTQLTTPESAELQDLLARMLKEGVTHVVMEVSSHSLQLERVHGCEFDVAVFTNLTHDHLDFHGNMQNYLNAKMKLFQRLGKGSKTDVTAVINVDDPCGKKIMTYIEGNILTYGVYNNANLTASDFSVDIERMDFNCRSVDGDIRMSSGMIGVYNAYNIMAAALVGRVFDIDYESIRDAVRELKDVPGRLERITVSGKPTVLVDFAHSPDSLQKLLETLRPLVTGRIILVFGCPGDRDRMKRPLMGEIAVRLSDHVIISTDDPHTEPPERIIREIEEGIIRGGGKLHKNYTKLEDRKVAITEAINMAKAGDLVVLAGRGHEKFQDFNGSKVKIDDREVAKEILGIKN